MFKIGDMVLVHKGMTEDSKIFDGLIGMITYMSDVNNRGYVILDIEEKNHRKGKGIWVKEISLVNLTQSQKLLRKNI